MDFLNGWRGAFEMALRDVEKAHALAEEHGCSIKRMDAEGYAHSFAVCWPNGGVFQEVLREGDLLETVQKLIPQIANSK